MYNPFKGGLIPNGYDLTRLDREADIYELESNFSGSSVLSSRYISPRGTGKTALINTFFTPEKCQELAQQHKLVRICQFSGDDMRTDAEVFVRLIGAVKDSLENMDPDSPEYERLCAELEKMEAKKPDYARDANEGESVLKDMLKYLKRRRYSVTLILDEFHQLACARHLADSTFSKMASLAQNDKLISYIVASDYDDTVGSDTYYVSQFSRIFGGEPTHLTGITSAKGKQALTELIRKKLAMCEDISFTQEELDTVYKLTGGIPEMIRLTLRDLFEVKQEQPDPMTEEQITPYALSACTKLMEKWVQYFGDNEWETMHAVLTAVKFADVTKILAQEQDERTSLEYAGLIIKQTRAQEYHPICPLFALYVQGEYARRQAREMLPAVSAEPAREATVTHVYNYNGCTLVTNSGDGTVSVAQNHLHQGVSVSEILTLLEAGRGDTRELFASNLAGSLRSRLQQHSLPQLSPADFASEAEFDQAYDKAFAEYSQNVVEDVQVDEEQELVVTPAQLQTLEERFAQARSRYRANLTDEMLAAQSERCRFYLKLSVIVEDALELPGIQMDDYSPQLVLYGKALEQSLRDHFYPLFRKEPVLRAYDTHHKNQFSNTFGAKTETDTNIGDYAHMIGDQQGYLANLCQSHIPGASGTASDWWNQLKLDIHEARKIRNLSDHANPVSPTRQDLDEMCGYLLGTSPETSILHRNLLGTQLFMKMFPPTITFAVRQSLMQQTCTMKCQTVKTQGNLQGILCNGGYQVKVSKTRAKAFRDANDCDGVDLTGRELLVRIIDCDKDNTYFSAEILRLLP